MTRALNASSYKILSLDSRFYHDPNFTDEGAILEDLTGWFVSPTDRKWCRDIQIEALDSESPNVKALACLTFRGHDRSGCLCMACNLQASPCPVSPKSGISWSDWMSTEALLTSLSSYCPEICILPWKVSLLRVLPPLTMRHCCLSLTKEQSGLSCQLQASVMDPW